MIAFPAINSLKALISSIALMIKDSGNVRMESLKCP